MKLNLLGFLVHRRDQLPVSSMSVFKLCTEVASILPVIDLGLDIRIACDGLQQKFQHVEYFTCDPLKSQLMFLQFQMVFTINPNLTLLNDNLYMMLCVLF